MWERWGPETDRKGVCLLLDANQELANFRAQVEQAKRDRMNQRIAPRDESKQAVQSRVKAMVQPVVEAFVRADRSLQLQSSTTNTFYVTFAHVRLCVVSIAANNNDTVTVTRTDGSESVLIYQGDVEEAPIRQATQESLLAWYKSVV